MLSLKWICVVFILFFTSALTTVLNIEELNSIHYSIDIVNSPVLKTQDWTTDIVTITNKHGQEYVCTLPQIQIPENENKKEEDLLDQLVDISELLKPMEAAPCLVKKKDWWSYEFCYGSVIKQYHLEENKVLGSILILGKYESEYNWKNNSKTKNKLQKFHTQSYVNGTRCDITGEPRRAEVRFHCEEGVGDYIQQVDEPESCRYVIIIATTRVCHHPYLKPNPNRTPHNINCAPALSAEEFEHYQRLQEVKKSQMEKDRLLLLDGEELKSTSDLDQEGDLVNAVGDNDTDEESKWSIRLVTIPITKKMGTASGSVQPYDLNMNTDFDEVVSESQESEPPSTDAGTSGDSAEPKDLGGKPYLNEKELVEREFDKIMKDFTDVDSDTVEKQEQEDDDDSEATGKDQETSTKRVEKQFQAFRNRMESLMGKWMEIQNEDHIQELLEKIKANLDENVHQLQETASKYSEDSLSAYLNDFAEMAEKYQKKLPKTDDFEFEDEQKLLDALHSLLDILSEAEVEVLKALHKKKKLERMEQYLESRLKQSEEAIASGDEGGSLSEGAATPSDGNADSSSLPAPSNPSPNPFKRFEDPIDPNEEDGIADKKNDEEVDENSGDTRHVRILNEKSIDGQKKTRLEQSIKERLQKSGLDNIGRKIEVKILTPNYLDDDEKDSLASLSQEESEAFHNMIVNILSASAEELKERERHKSLESNYNFRLEEEPEIDLLGLSAPEEVEETNPSSLTNSNNDDDNSKDSNNGDSENGNLNNDLLLDDPN